jgi:hypothetical protein
MATEICNTKTQFDTDAAMIFFDDVDMRGPFMPLSELENFVETAPAEARQHPDFQYLIGLLDGRRINEVWGGVDAQTEKERN